jgi:hypothetical protein
VKEDTQYFFFKRSGAATFARTATGPERKPRMPVANRSRLSVPEKFASDNACPDVIKIRFTVFAEALRLHALGYAVVPCEGKGCRVPEWQKVRIQPEQLIERYHKPGANLAIALNLSNVVDVECDTPEAEPNLQLLFGGQIPPTPTWKSKRGNHRLFRRPPDLSTDLAKIDLDGIEFRLGDGKGAISVIPPSVHPDGPRYEWLPGLSIDDVAPAELPADIVRRLNETRKPIPTRGAIDGEMIPEVFATTSYSKEGANSPAPGCRWWQSRRHYKR